MRLVWAVAFLALAACYRPLPPEPSCGFQINIHTGQRVSWAGRLPVPIRLTTSFPDDLHSALLRAEAEYARALRRPVFADKGYGNAYDGAPFITSGTLDVDTEGQTHTAAVGKEIFEAFITLNLLNYTFSSDTPAPNEIDAESLFLHELGHLLGLVHTDDMSSIMYPVLDYGQTRRTLTPLDINHLECEYGHVP